MSEKTDSDPVEIRDTGFGRVRRAWEALVRAVLRPFRPTVLRVWRLGSAEHRVIPTAQAFDHLARMLHAVHPDEDCDIIWDPFLDVTVLRGAKALDIVAGPGLRVTREGNVVRVEQEDSGEKSDGGLGYHPDGTPTEDPKKFVDMGGSYGPDG